MSFTIFQNEKTPFQAIKTRSSKSRKIDVFLKGLTHGIGPKMAIFPTFLLRQYRPGKYIFSDILERKNAFLGYKNKKFKKSKKLTFFQTGQPMVLFKTRPFFQLFFQAIQARKMSFIIFQNEKTPFQAIKRRSSKSQKIDIFPKGLTHSFGPKMAIFPTFIFLSNIGQENVFYDILERKNALKGYKNKKLKKSKN